jgi:PAS domain S-box-containing protein
MNLEHVLQQHLSLIYAKHLHRVWVMDSTGKLLYQSEHRDMVLRNIRQREEKCGKCHFSFDYAERMLKEKSGITDYHLNDRPKKLAAFATMEFENVSWMIVLNAPYEEVTAVAKRTLHETLMLLGVVVLALVGSSAFMYRSYRLKVKAEEEARQWREKRELEDKIRQSEERYRRLVELSPDTIAIHSEGKVVFMNTAGAKLLGAATPDELIGKPVMDFLHPDYWEIVKERIRQIREEGRGTPLIEEKFVRLDGTVVDVEVAAIPFTYQNKPAVQVIVRDITERKQVEEAIRKSELQFRLVWESSADGMRLTDEQGTVVMVNEAFCRMVGKPKEAMEGKPLSVIYTEEQQAHILRRHQERFRARTVSPHFERELTLWNGTKVWFEVSNSFFELEGHIPLLLGIFRDITERKRAGEERERLIHELQDALAHVKQLSGLLPICASCKKIRDDGGYWHQVEQYVMEHTEVKFTHGVCPECMKKLYPEYYKKHYEESK